MKALVLSGEKGSRFRPLIIIGVITVALFSRGENSARATVIFSDGFESGDTSAWSFVLNANVTSSSAHSGKYSAFCNTSDVFHVTAEGLSDSAGWGNHVFARGYFRLGSMVGYDWTQRDLLYMTHWSDGVEVMICNMAIGHRTGNDYIWAMNYLDGSGMDSAQTSPFVLNTTAWYCIEIESYIASSGGYFNLYINGVIMFSEMGVNNAGQGVINHIGFGQLESGYSYHVNTWWDDCVIAGSYIGPEPSGDLNGDGAVDSFDFFILLQAWGTSPPSDPRADANGDGTVDSSDFYILLQNWGRTYP